MEFKSVKQKRHPFGAEKDGIIEKKVQKLLKAGHIKKIQFPTWLSNGVLLKKTVNKWRMCIDFRDLNKACPKDYYLLPRIEWCTLWHPLRSFTLYSIAVEYSNSYSYLIEVVSQDHAS